MEYCCKRSRHALEIFPAECWQSIFNHLGDDGLEAISLVCKAFLENSNFCKNSLQVVHSDVWILSKLLKRFKQLKKISFSRQFTGDLKEAILEIARSKVSLKVLEYEGNKPFDYSDLVVIANSFPKLEKLKVARSDIPIEHSQSKFINDGVEYAALKLKLLKKIHMSRWYCVSDRSLVALPLNCAFLKSVKVYNLCGCDGGVTETGIGFLLRNLPNLEALTLGSINMDSSQSGINLENSISHAKSLKSLKLNGMEVSDMLLSAISKANLPLRKFRLKYCSNFTVEGLLGVLSNCQLTKLCIVQADLGDSDMKLVLNRNVGSLTHIDISCFLLTSSTLFLLSTKCPLLKEIRMPFADFYENFYAHGDIPLMSKNHNVQNICLRYTNVGDEWVKQLALLFPNIRVLDLSRCCSLTSTGIEAILKSCKFIRKLILEGYGEAKLVKDNSEFPELMNLEDLDLSCSLIVDEGLSAITEKCGMLVSLDLSRCYSLTSTGIEAILKSCKFIRKLILAGYGEAKLVKDNSEFPELMNLEDLDLSCSLIVDEGLSAITEKCGMLVSLDLSRCYSLTSTGIEAILKSCKFIRKLILAGYGEAKLVKDNSEFPELMNLEDLDLCCSLIVDEGLSAITVKCGRLVSLNLRSCKRVTTECIKNIVKKVTTLKCIHISSCYDHTVDDLLEWMLCTANFASLKKIYVGDRNFTEKHKEEFLQHGCLLLGDY